MLQVQTILKVWATTNYYQSSSRVSDDRYFAMQAIIAWNIFTIN